MTTAENSTNTAEDDPTEESPTPVVAQPAQPVEVPIDPRPTHPVDDTTEPTPTEPEPTEPEPEPTPPDTPEPSEPEQPEPIPTVSTATAVELIANDTFMARMTVTIARVAADMQHTTARADQALQRDDPAAYADLQTRNGFITQMIQDRRAYGWRLAEMAIATTDLHAESTDSELEQAVRSIWDTVALVAWKKHPVTNP